MMLASLPKKEIRGVFTDLDGTLTEESRISENAYEAVSRLEEAGFWVVIVSGRPAGWANCLVRLWPIHAMIFENGAGLVVREGEKLRTIRLASDKTLSEQKKILQSLFDRLKTQVPNLKLASDQPHRLFDFAIDYCEEAPNLTPNELDFVLKELSKEKNITAKLSSIHVNYWCGSHTKVTACEYLFQTEGRERKISKDDVVFCGDSPNDEPLFGYFKHTVGVANIRQFLGQMKSTPKYLTKSKGGAGFQELAKILLS